MSPRPFELRQYTLKTPEAAATYLAIWQKHPASLAQFGITTHAVFSDPADPLVVLALVSYPAGADPESLTREYMASEAFKADMAGFDFGVFDNVVPRALVAAPFSPLQ